MRHGSAFTPTALAHALDLLDAGAQPLIAYSGGLDSHALLHACAALRESGGRTPGALHVDHGLQAQAPDWAAHCRDVCSALEVALQVVAAPVRGRRGESPEAAARRTRYGAFADCLAPGQVLLTAHTLDDQAETLLLRLLRGSGVAGGVGIRSRRALGAGQVARPLLGFSRAALQAYARAAGLDWVEDPSNRELRYDRNFLRHRVLPLLRERWPAAPAILARDAAHFAAADEVLWELADEHLASLAPAPGERLELAGLRRLTAARQSLVLRRWLARQGLQMPTSAQLRQLWQLAGARADRQGALRLGGRVVRRYRGHLYLGTTLAPPPAARSWPLPAPLTLPGRAQPLTLAEFGPPGLALPPGARVEVRFRQGGERMRLAGQAHSKPLKQLFQERGVPPWLRPGVPLLYVDGVLAAVAGIGVAAGFAAAPVPAAAQTAPGAGREPG